MAKSTTARATKRGDIFLATAVFCDQTLEERPVEPSTAGVVSAIRIFDTLTVEIPADQPVNGVPGVKVNCLIVLRTNAGPTKCVVQLVWVTPSGKRRKMPEKELGFIGKGLSSFHLKINVGIPVVEEGDHWFNVMVDGRRLTAMPLRIVLQREKSARRRKA